MSKIDDAADKMKKGTDKAADATKDAARTWARRSRTRARRSKSRDNQQRSPHRGGGGAVEFAWTPWTRWPRPAPGISFPQGMVRPYRPTGAATVSFSASGISMLNIHLTPGWLTT